jgi:hypothetical protein
MLKAEELSYNFLEFARNLNNFVNKGNVFLNTGLN